MDNEMVFYTNIPDTQGSYKAKLKFISEKEYVLLKGSYIRKSGNDSFNDKKSPWYYNEKLNLINKGVFDEVNKTDKVYLLNRDILFDNPSKPACIATGAFMNGKNIWKLENGISLKDFLNKSYSHINLDKYLYEFKNEADNWFNEKSFIRENYLFFKSFYDKIANEEAKIDDFLEIANHVHAMQSNKKRGILESQGFYDNKCTDFEEAFKFIYYETAMEDHRIYGKGIITDPDKAIIGLSKLKGIGPSAASEIVGNLLIEEYIPVNERDLFAASFLDIYKSNKISLKEFNQAIKNSNLKEKYEEIVGRKTDLPINLEIDQFFSYLYTQYSKNN